VLFRSTLFSDKAQEKGLALHFRIAPGTPLCLVGDPLRLGQVLVNLVGNAIKFTEKGSVTVSVAPAGTAPHADKRELCFSVNDTGLGMTPEQRSGLFQAFSQADTSTTRRFGGTGLGLVISSELVALMGGRMEVDSAPGQGSSFRFIARFASLPESQCGGEAAALAPGKEISEILKGKRILLVEDNEMNQQVAGEIMGRAGMAVHIVDDGQKAVAAVSKSPYDLVLMDIQMPVMDSLAATRAIRALPKLRQAPIIAMTAHASQEERERCLIAGMNDFLTKPFVPALLFQVLARHLDPGLAAETHELGNDAPTPAPEGTGLDRQQGLMHCAHNENHYRRLLAHFQAKECDILERLRQALDDGKAETAHRLAHSLKGMAGTLGAHALRRQVEEVEQLLREPGQPEILLARLYDADAEMERVLREIGEILGNT
jgi:CheY-like chemotaxis protein/HPt (histidine-containing phosphotransfer) domain-containing protein